MRHQSVTWNASMSTTPRWDKGSTAGTTGSISSSSSVHCQPLTQIIFSVHTHFTTRLTHTTFVIDRRLWGTHLSNDGPLLTSELTSIAFIITDLLCWHVAIMLGIYPLDVSRHLCYDLQFVWDNVVRQLCKPWHWDQDVWKKGIILFQPLQRSLNMAPPDLKHV